MKYSIVTVAYNEENRISETIESVLNQDFSGFEYIVVDGESKDSTLDIANSYIKKFAEKGIEYRVYSEKDNGVYNAMNKSLNYVRGEYVLFMNAGDSFENGKVISSVSSCITGNPDVMYGNTIFAWKNLIKLVKCEDFDIVKEYMPFCHQSVFVRTAILEKFKFNEKYKICADYDLFVKIFNSNMNVIKMDIVLSKFVVGGLSYSDCGRQEVLETTEIRYRNGFIDEAKKNTIIKEYNAKYKFLRIKAWIKAKSPEIIMNWILSQKYLRNGWSYLKN